jgi:hypothetical protein
MWKLIKWLFFIALIALIVLWITDYKIGGKSVKDYFKGVVGEKTYDEGVKDIRSLVGEAIKAVGDVVSPEVTPEEQKELEGVIQKELGKGGGPAPAPVQPQTPQQSQ